MGLVQNALLLADRRFQPQKLVRFRPRPLKRVLLLLGSREPVQLKPKTEACSRAGGWGPGRSFRANAGEHDAKRTGARGGGGEAEDRRGTGGSQFSTKIAPTSPFERLDRPGSLKHPSKHMKAYSNRKPQKGILKTQKHILENGRLQVGRRESGVSRVDIQSYYWYIHTRYMEAFLVIVYIYWIRPS